MAVTGRRGAALGTAMTGRSGAPLCTAVTGDRGAAPDTAVAGSSGAGGLGVPLGSNLSLSRDLRLGVGVLDHRAAVAFLDTRADHVGHGGSIPP